MSIVAETVLTYLPPKRKTTPGGWTSFNAPCCVHNGHSADTRGRGGLIANPDGGISYHCFNCGFKTSWQPGRNLSHKMRKLLQWLGAADETITKIALSVLRENEGVEGQENIVKLPVFYSVPLPEGSIRINDITEWDEYSIALLEYMSKRHLNPDDTDYYYCSQPSYRSRLILPFFYEGVIVGWTARHIGKQTPKYLTQVSPGFVYGLDEQRSQKIFCIVCEGQIDAIHVEGCALGGSEINDQQALLLNRLGKQIIVVPDRDRNGKNLAEQAIERGWSVSMPDWPDDCKDVSDCVARHGRLYTLYSIASAAEESPLKIRLRMKKWFG